MHGFDDARGNGCEAGSSDRAENGNLSIIEKQFTSNFDFEFNHEKHGIPKLLRAVAMVTP